MAGVKRDVQLTFHIVIEVLTGGSAGQKYQVEVKRGDKIRCESPVVAADAKGEAAFAFSRTFTSTLQRKNDNAYHKKELRVRVFEIPNRFAVANLTYDLSKHVIDETFPFKKLMTKSPSSDARLFFTLRGDKERPVGSPASANRWESGSSSAVDLSMSVVSFVHEPQTPTGRAASVTSTPPNSTRSTDTDTAYSRPGLAPAVKPPQRPPPRAARSASTSEDFSDVVDALLSSRGSVASTPKAVTAPPPPESQAAEGCSSRPIGLATGTKVPTRSEEPLNRSSPAPAALKSLPAHQPLNRGSPAAPMTPPVGRSSAAPPLSTPPPSQRDSSHLSANRSAAAARSSITARATGSASAGQRACGGPISGDEDVSTSSGQSLRATIDPPSASYTAPISRIDLVNQSLPREVSRYSASTADQSLSKNIENKPQAGRHEATSSDSHICSGSVASANQVTPGRTNPPMSNLVRCLEQRLQWYAAFDAGPAVTNPSSTFTFYPSSSTCTSIPKAALEMVMALRMWKIESLHFLVRRLCVWLLVEVVPSTRHFGRWIAIISHVLYDTVARAADGAEVYEPLVGAAHERAVTEFNNFRRALDGFDSSFSMPSRQVFTWNPGREADKALSRLIPDGSERFPQHAPPEGLGIVGNVLPPAAVLVLAGSLQETIRRLAIAAVERYAESCVALLVASLGELRSNGPLQRNVGSSCDPTAPHILDGILDSTLGLMLVDLCFASGPTPVLSTAPLSRIVVAAIVREVAVFVVQALQSDCCVSGVFMRTTGAVSVMRIVEAIERWLQRHSLFLAVAPRLNPLRCLCDLVLMPKRLLSNKAYLRTILEVLTPCDVLYVLRRYQPDPRDVVLDETPAQVLDYLNGLREDSDHTTTGERCEEPATAHPRAMASVLLKADVVPVAKRLAALDVIEMLFRFLPGGDGEATSGEHEGHTLGRKQRVTLLRQSLRVDVAQQNNECAATDACLNTLILGHQGERAVEALRLSEALFSSVEYCGESNCTEAIREKVALRLIAVSLADDEYLKARHSIPL